MIPKYTARFLKAFKNLPKIQQSKFEKSKKLFFANPRHPSLRARKESGSDIYEARLDYHYRFTYMILGNDIYFLLIGPHDSGLGKK